MGRLLTAVRLSMAIFCSTAVARIINIPADYPTIQAGIDASVNGDTVLVAHGTYYENISFDGHQITMASLFLVSANYNEIVNTKIIGDGTRAVITFNQHEDSSTALIGFTVSNNRSNHVDYYGVLCDSSSPMIDHNRIIENNALAAVYCRNSNSPLKNNLIVDNHAVGLYCVSNSNPQVVNCVICNNDFNNYTVVCLQTNLDTLYLNLRDTFSISKSFRF